MSRWIIVAVGVATFLVTTIVVLLTLNLTLGNKQVDEPVGTDMAVAEPRFVRLIGLLMNHPILEGNQVVALQNGNEIFPAMLDAIRAAQRTITFETYIYWQGTIGAEFADALVERARAGVHILVTLDWWGSEIDESHIARIEAAGVKVRRYNPPRIGSLGRMNHRTHRKLLVVDGRIGFTGGVGIADPWRGNAQDPQHWRDTHFRVEGPVVAQMQAAFLDNWVEATGEVPLGREYFPALENVGTQAAQMFTSAPGGGAESMQLMYLISIASARSTLRLSAAYFVPDNVAVKALVAARTRGVRVEIILPGPHMDRTVVRRASRFEWGPLLRAGVEIYEYQPTMYHCKVMIVDEIWTTVGSTNFDSRSFSLNDEANLSVHDAAFAKAQVRIFEEDLANSKRVSLAEWEGRPWSDRILDALAGLLSAQL